MAPWDPPALPVGHRPLELRPSSGMVLSFLGGVCSNELGGAEAGVQIAEKVSGFIYANGRRKRRSAHVNQPADKAGVHSCVPESRGR